MIEPGASVGLERLERLGDSLKCSDWLASGNRLTTQIAHEKMDLAIYIKTFQYRYPYMPFPPHSVFHRVQHSKPKRKMGWPAATLLRRLRPLLHSSKYREASDFQQHTANMPNRFGRVETLGANRDTVLDTLAAKHAKRVRQLREPLCLLGIATVGQKTVGLQ